MLKWFAVRGRRHGHREEQGLYGQKVQAVKRQQCLFSTLLEALSSGLTNVSYVTCRILNGANTLTLAYAPSRAIGDLNPLSMGIWKLSAYRES